MGISDYVNNAAHFLASTIGAPLLVRAAGTLESAASLVSLIAGANDGLLVDATGARKNPTGSTTGAITASNSTTYDPPLRVIWATGAGNITVVLAGETTSTVVFAVAANERVVDFEIAKVMATGTTATGISGAC